MGVSEKETYESLSVLDPETVTRPLLPQRPPLSDLPPARDGCCGVKGVSGSFCGRRPGPEPRVALIVLLGPNVRVKYEHDVHGKNPFSLLSHLLGVVHWGENHRSTSTINRSRKGTTRSN